MIFGKQNASRAGAIVAEMNEKQREENQKKGINPGAEPPADPPATQDPPPADPPAPDTPASDPPPADPPAPDDKQDPPADPAGKQGSPDPQVPPAPETPPAPEGISDQAVFSLLSEKLKREISSFADLEVTQELSPELKQLQEWSEKTGLPVADWPKYTRDFSKMTDLEVAREILAEQFPTFNQEEIEYKMRDFVYDENLDDEAEQMRKRVALKEFATKARQQLEQKRLELKPAEVRAISPEQQKALDDYAKIVESQATADASAKAYKQGLDTAATSFEPLTLNLAEGLTLTYDTAERKNLPEMVETMPHWYNEDGSVNHTAIVQDALKIRDFDKIVSTVFEQGIHYGKEGKMRQDNNTDLDPGAPPATGGDGKKKGNVDDVVDSIVGNRGRGLVFKPKMK